VQEIVAKIWFQQQKNARTTAIRNEESDFELEAIIFETLYG